MSVRILCPECGKFLGRTKDSVNIRLYCKNCHELKDINIRIAPTADYLRIPKEEKK